MFYEDGEPKIDGEAGDLKVYLVPCEIKINATVID